MKLSKIYSNDSRFESIIFNTNNINVILATGNKPHSIGKTTLFRLINYCLLKDEKPKFLKQNVFKDFTFYLELQISENKFITIKRSVSGRANSCIKLHDTYSDCTTLKDDEYDFKGGDEGALIFLNEKLLLSINRQSIENFRKYLGYFLRDKDDFSHPFMLNKYKKGKDIEWKTIVASMIGLDKNSVRKKFDIEKQIEKLENEIKYLEDNENCSISDIEVINETILVLYNEVQEKEKLYREFDFYLKENNINKELVVEVEEIISELNRERYSLDKKNRLIEKSLIKEQEIDLKKVQKLFNEVNIKLNDMLVKSYEEVIDFNTRITQDRENYLKSEQQEIIKRLKEIDKILKEENQKRKDLLSVLTEKDTFSKFKKIELEIVELKNKIHSTESFSHLLKGYKCRLRRIRVLNRRKEKTILAIDHSIKNQNEVLQNIRTVFKQISKMVFGVEAILSVSLNSSNNLEFRTKVIDTKKILENTKEEGEAFGRMFCFIFDVSIVLTHKNENFFKFIAHDGLFDNLGEQYKKGIVDVLNLLVENDIQYIFTSIEDEIEDTEFLAKCKSEYLVRELADTEQKRLFKMDTF
ncbi:hypothetical protein [Aliarcobacter butzleri]|uniref:hypothetical protein n=1 Tax=Aliarcobacter butzleri TaxID=28197 RepID=UPI0021B525AE|nr:hypothetical protein [Aliarcobacter butzleri]MCT7570850.1 hypothetical protein [Aliarcobacter butzleri]